VNANKQDAGGLPVEFLKNPAAVVYPDTGYRSDAAGLQLWQMFMYDTGGEPLFSADQVRELCRAAPAGGDVAPDIKPDGFDTIEISGCDDIEQLRSWAHCMRRERDNWRQRALDAEMELVGDNGLDPPDTAPAGSGEVSSLIERLESTARAYPEDVFTPLTDEQKKTYGWVVQAASAGMGRHMAPLLLEAAALLRKLQQGAESDEVMNAVRRYGAGFTNDEIRSFLSASQGQEGGHARD
jgi:hypothetical protein